VITHVVMFSLDAPDRYRVHPAHEEVAAYVAEASEMRAAVDYEL
jgi:hypothetical protein